MNPSDLVLVAVMKSKRDFEIARVLGWYRIPVKTAPKTVAADWLAFYQTASFGEEKWAIHYVAPVRGHELATRAELLQTQPDHPRAREQYYKIQIGPLERLERPVPSRSWRRITFLYTTAEKLLAASEINDLIVQSPERERLWAALRERGLRAERQYQSGGAGELDLAILCQLGNLGLLFGDRRDLRDSGNWRYLTFPEASLSDDLKPVVDLIEQTVNHLGGPNDGR